MSSFRIKSSAAELTARARAITGIHDIADPDMEEALPHLLASLNAEAQLSEAGAAAMEQRILRTLNDRLRMFRDFKRHPEIEEQRIVRPLMLTGGGRTGSTKLHLLLAASGDFQFMTFWQAHALSLRSGDRDEDPAERIADAEEFIRWFDLHAPRARMIHAYDTFEPEEETHITEKGLFGLMFCAFAFLPSFAQWYVTQDFGLQLEFLKRALKYLQWQFHDGDPRPWVLKNPLYQGWEPELQAVFPDAVFVATHRDPVASLTSSCSLQSAYFEAYSDVSMNPMIGQMQLGGPIIQHQRLFEARRNHPEIGVFDVSYTELLKSPMNVVEKIYAHANMELSQRAREAMLAWERKNAQHKHGVHKYTLEEFSLDRKTVEEKFAPYIEHYRHCF